MKKIKLLCLFLLTVKILTAQISSFNGKFQLDLNKSNLGNAPVFVVYSKMSLEVRNDSLFLKGLKKHQTGDSSWITARYSLKGDKIEKTAQDNSKVQNSFNWSSDHSQLIKSQIYFNKGDLIIKATEIKEQWYLSDSGEMLTIDQVVQKEAGEGYSIKAVYNRLDNDR